MFRWEEFSGIYLHRGYVDMRKSINGLSVIVQNDMKLNPFSKFLFVFCNKNKNRLKILYWDKTGFALWLKMLDRSSFIWPKKLDHEVIELNRDQLKWLLCGLDILKMKPHQELCYESVS